MRPEDLKRLLDDVRAGDLPVAEAAGRLSRVLPTPGAGRLDDFAHLDHHRGVRCGFPEVVLGSAKEPNDLVRIARSILERAETLLVTRVDQERAEALCGALPDATHHRRARAVTVLRGERPAGTPGILILTAGTGDIPVAEEARVTAEAMGQAPEVIHDLGVAGIHRILGQQERLREARVVVVAAGMDGALPSVVGGLVGVPVIAVPTSVGYGTAFEGLAPLLSMLNACSPNVAVVNVDNGFGAGTMASLINQSAP